MKNRRQALIVLALTVLLALGGLTAWTLLDHDPAPPLTISSAVVDESVDDSAVTPRPTDQRPEPEIVRPAPAPKPTDEGRGEAPSPDTEPAPETPSPDEKPDEKPDVPPREDIIVVDFVDKSFHSVVHFLALKTGLNVNVEGKIQLHVTVMRKIPKTQEAVLDLLNDLCEHNKLSLTHDGSFVIIKNR